VCARSSRPVEETSEPPALPSKKKGQHIPPQQQVHAVPDEDGGVVCARSSHPIEQTSEPPALPSKKGQQVPPQQQEVCAVPDTGGSEVVVKQQQPAQQGAAYDGYMSVREETQDVTYAVPGGVGSEVFVRPSRADHHGYITCGAADNKDMNPGTGLISLGPASAASSCAAVATAATPDLVENPPVASNDIDSTRAPVGRATSDDDEDCMYSHMPSSATAVGPVLTTSDV